MHDDLAECLPRVLPDGWVILRRFGDGYAAQCRNGLRVIASTCPMEDGRDWLHISVSREKRLPSWDDMKLAKSMFVGDHRYAYQVFPAAEHFVNIHPFCLHLYAPLTGDLPLPDFTMGGQSI